MSIELGFGVAPFDGVEIGALAGATRAGAELRVGVLGRSHGFIAGALSVGFARHLLLPPSATGWRVGIDLSARTRFVMPILDVYLGYEPSERRVLFADSTSGPDGLANLRMDRDELRLSIPVGAALWPSMRKHASNLILAVVPEITLASREDPATRREAQDAGLLSFRQTWAVFLVLRGEYMTRAPLGTVQAPHAGQ